ncbi:aminoglycoside 6-adenylyltransferase [Morganella morganii]|uniref:Aminoglycoside 6-adenylyltransferase n=1 Tax=Morganella morganii TaxID=582 RepID=A0A9Q4GRV1_MORMO|nr:aminoglycoside 6-adenylyltransferase [Morganella morganii]EKW7744564.1 aminoglycoside 6-adenylyltransferase [Morganella morganii]MCY0788190.1 aminoglycoside 6-adenylyltransferase [Morganella morganii]HCR3197883.1 aminoglycoside 6-adenylyltransferase [Morganella morganii]HCT4930932.1 aminoglycoside 6-adenylyltransferase [Morganella morganii]HCT8188074.1 aminoglycoside 6-adenylyltransferase [Morganella morganii]
MESIEQIINTIISFALLDPRIDAVIITGPAARQNQAERFSDINTELIGSNPDELFHDSRWLNRFGVPLIIRKELSHESGGVRWPCCQVLYEKGRKAGFMLAGRERITRMAEHGLDNIYQRGYAVLLDKTGVTAGLPEYADPASLLTPPDQQTFLENWQNFWLEASQVPVYYLRNETWTARLRDVAMKQWLITLLEWHVLLRSDSTQDVWYAGRHLSTWLPPALYGRFMATLDNRDRVRAARAYMAMLTLYRDVAIRVIDAQKFDIDITLADKIIALVTDRLNTADLLTQENKS